MSNTKTKCLFDRELLNGILTNELHNACINKGDCSPEDEQYSSEVFWLQSNLNNLFDHYNQLTGV